VFDHSGGLPRRINRLCARVLLYGAIEETDDITKAMVDTTAEELAQDLEGGRPASAFPALGADLHADLHAALHGGDGPHDGGGAAALAELRLRVDALESRMARRERVFQRLLDTLSAYGAGQR
jgi:hypothetical protein